MKQTYIVNQTPDNRTATMRLYGVIGERVDGDLFAQELASLDGCDLVKIHVNSPGGDVPQGMSIVSAMLSMTTPVHIHIDGVAASMAAVIAACADRVIMWDFSQYMIHDPQYSTDAELIPKQKKTLARMRNMLLKVLTRRGKSEEDIGKLMSAETWFNAAEAQAAGLCDEVLPSTRAMVGLTPLEICARVLEDDQQQLPNNTLMKITPQAAVALGISDSASEADISAGIEKMHAKLAEATQAKATAQEAQAATEAKLMAIEKAAAEARKVEAEGLIEAAIKGGKINAQAKDAYAALFASNHDQAKAALAAIPERQTIVGALAGAAGAAATPDILAKSWDELDKANQLVDLKAKHPESYVEKFTAKFGCAPKS